MFRSMIFVKTALQYLRERSIYPCESSWEWLKTYTPAQLATAYAECPKLSWLVWLAGVLVPRERIVVGLCAVYRDMNRAHYLVGRDEADDLVDLCEAAALKKDNAPDFAIHSREVGKLRDVRSLKGIVARHIGMYCIGLGNAWWAAERVEQSITNTTEARRLFRAAVPWPTVYMALSRRSIS